MNLLSTITLIVVVVIVRAGGEVDVSASSKKASLIVKRQGEMFDEPLGSPDTKTSQPLQQPKIERMHVTSHIEYRFANTRITSQVINPANVSQEVFFSVTLPENAFISKFLMEMDGKVYEASVQEKGEAKRTYDSAVASGQGAAHVEASARNSNLFTVSVNVEPHKEVTFNLTYEELLTRKLGAYNHVINLLPRQVVGDFKVDVYIKEDRNITVLRVPELRSGNEVDPDENSPANSLATVEQGSPRQAHISFAPSESDQRRLGQVKPPIEQDESEFIIPVKPSIGLGGQFVVQYDVDRSEKPGEVLVNDGYFVHFFAPQDLLPLPKHALFVLDVSGSMDGRKMEQMKEAMKIILNDLNKEDFFNIIEFSDTASVWDLDAPIPIAPYDPYGEITERSPLPSLAYPATAEYISKARDHVSVMQVKGGTNIHDALKTAIRVARESVLNVTDRPQPIIVFLTDGQPTVGITGLDEISSAVARLNENPVATIFSLAFGDNADLDFLKKVSLKNAGFARKIYEASDATLQLRDFYRQISSPLLANVTFIYPPGQVDEAATTRTHFNTLFSGSEIIVAGRIIPSLDERTNAIRGEVLALSNTGDSHFDIGRPIFLHQLEDKPVTPLERLWAYLTIRQLLEESEAKSIAGDVTQSGTNHETQTLKNKALSLALKYSFVTPLTSLVVVKPDNTKETGDVRTAESGNDLEFASRMGTAMYAAPLAFAPAPPHAKYAAARASSFHTRSQPLPPYGPGGPGGPPALEYADVMLDSDLMDLPSFPKTTTSQPITRTSPTSADNPNLKTLAEEKAEEGKEEDNEKEITCEGPTPSKCIRPLVRTDDDEEMGDNNEVKIEGEKERQHGGGTELRPGSLIGSWSGPWLLPSAGLTPGCHIGVQVPHTDLWAWRPYQQTSHEPNYWWAPWDHFNKWNGFISGIGNLGFGNIGLFNNGWGNNGWGNSGWGNVGLHNTGWANNGWGNLGWGNVGWGNNGWGNHGWGNNGWGNIGWGNNGWGNIGWGNRLLER